MPVFNFAQLEYIWVAAGGDPQAAAMAASVALGESGGNSDAVSPTDDVGLWQINVQAHGTAMASKDVMTNARSAIAVSNNGKNWRPWCTCWTVTCSQGEYLAPSVICLQALNKFGGNVPPDSSTPVNATNAAGNQPAPQTTTVNTQTVQLNWMCLLAPGLCAAIGVAKDPGAILNPMSIIDTIFRVYINFYIEMLAGVMGIIGGGILIIVGIYMIVSNTQAGQGMAGSATKAAQIGVTAAAPETAPFLARTATERAAATRGIAARAAETGRQTRQTRGFAQQTGERQAREAASRRPKPGTRTTTVRNQKGNKTTYTTTRQVLNGEAEAYTNRGGPE